MRWFRFMRSVPLKFVSGRASEFSAIECCWRESERSFTGYVAECWFVPLPSAFAGKWAAVVGYQVRVRCVAAGPARFAVSVPVVVPQGSIGCLAASAVVGGAGGDSFTVCLLAVWGFGPFPHNGRLVSFFDYSRSSRMICVCSPLFLRLNL